MDAPTMNNARLFRRDIAVITAAAALMALFCLAAVWFSPPHEGDSSEYASVARNLARGLGLQEDFIKDYVRADFSVPHPATARGAFYPFVLVPFYLMFRESILSLAVPGAIALFAIPPLVYLLGFHFIGRRAAFWGAALTIIFPSLCGVYLFGEPCEPEMLMAALYILCAMWFLKGRHWLAGAMFGLAFLCKQSGIVLAAAVVLHVLVFDRRRETLAGTARFFAAALIVAAPFFVRNTIVFHHPLYSEQMLTMPRVINDHYGRNMAGESMLIANDFDLNTGPAAPPLPAGEGARRFAVFISKNAWWMLSGRMLDLGYTTGLIEMYDIFLFAFMAAGAWLLLRGKRFALIPLIFILHVGFSLLSPSPVIRYLVPAMPFGCLLAAAGLAGAFRSGEKYLRPAFFFVFVTEFIFVVVSVFGMAFPERRTNNFLQLSAVCDWSRTSSDKSVIVGFPYHSINYLCDRPAVTFPSGDVGTLGRVIDKYDAGMLYYKGDWMGDRFPALPGLMPAASNGKAALFFVDPREFNPEAAAYLKGINLYDYFQASRFKVELMSPFPRKMRRQVTALMFPETRGRVDWEASPWRTLAGWAVALPLYLGAFLIFAAARPIYLRIPVSLALIGASAVFSILPMTAQPEMFPRKAPDVSVLQTFSFIESRLKESGANELSVGINRPPDYLSNLIEKHPDRERFLPTLKRLRVSGWLSFDNALDARKYDIVIYIERPPEELFTDAEAVGRNVAAYRDYYGRLVRMAGLPGLAGKRMELVNGGLIFF